jgi:DNA-binding phage protein
MPKSAKTSSKTKTVPYDVAEQLRTPEEMAAYLDAWLAEAPDDAAGIARAQDDIARAKGISQVLAMRGSVARAFTRRCAKREPKLRHRAQGCSRARSAASCGSDMKYERLATMGPNPSIERHAPASQVMPLMSNLRRPSHG